MDRKGHVNELIYADSSFAAWRNAAVTLVENAGVLVVDDGCATPACRHFWQKY